jgi:hypothetical protein
MGNNGSSLSLPLQRLALSLTSESFTTNASFACCGPRTEGVLCICLWLHVSRAVQQKQPAGGTPIVALRILRRRENLPTKFRRPL